MNTDSLNLTSKFSIINGPNGSGKSTTLKVIYKDFLTQKLPVAYLPAANVYDPAEGFHKDKSVIDRDVFDSFLQPFYLDLSTKLSDGAVRKYNIALTVAAKGASVVLIDEIDLFQDEESIPLLIDLLKQRVNENGKTIIITAQRTIAGASKVLEFTSVRISSYD
jgi:ABC-type multidrug transport system ATPase subunit